ncbi:fungal-specific transcription factor domain-containing protein [Xylariaceae sp. FL0255]|nr:fungal-specific transcription factor domain-containing protein [Xylariaceae sp. FL0255]
MVSAGVDRTKRASKVRSPMRSSIACTRCRRSKIKCENVNGTSPCDSCIKTGNECIFKVPDPVPPKRSQPPTPIKQERDWGSDRKRLKKIDGISKVENQTGTVYAEDVLNVPFLTEDLWEQILDLYKLHFATELPFLHLPTMKEKLARRSKTTCSEIDSDNNLVLLGVLTLTARFHPDLVKYLAHITTNQPGNARTRPVQTHLDPAAASEYYAEVLAMALGPVRTMMSRASVDRVSALLMLGLYEWSQTQPKAGGMTAWMYVGTAIRMAQFLELGFQDAQQDPRESKFEAVDLQLKSSGCQSQLALQKETRRRVMFSCFVLDRMLACGKHRVPIIQGNDLEIQLPCSEDKFDLAMDVRTGYLKDDVPGADDSVLSRFIKLVDLWGEISSYSSRGGRLREKYPPWNEKSMFYELTKDLEKLDSSLPGTFTFSRSNYFKHENHQASSAYVLLHMLRFVCLIMLHREYVPFVPIRCQQPEGPLDHPTFKKEETPPGFWRMSAEKLFKAARGIVDLIEICQRKDKLPQSTIVLFAIWTASFVGLYSVHFRQMDTERHMLSFDKEDSCEVGPDNVFSQGPTALAYHTLIKMSTWLKMASTYVGILTQMDRYFRRIQADYHLHLGTDGRPNRGTLRVREGGLGGGLEEYQPLVGKLKDFGVLRPEDSEVMDHQGRLARNLSRSRTGNSNNVSPSHSAPPGSFTPINNSAGSGIPSESSGNVSRAATVETVSGQTPSEHYTVDPWRHHSAPQQSIPPQHQHQQSPAQAYPTPGSVLDQTQPHHQYDQTSPEDNKRFWAQLEGVEWQRFSGISGDLRLFSTGKTHPDMPLFADPNYIPVMDVAASYDMMQQNREYGM